MDHITEFLNNPGLDVICIGNNIKDGGIRISDRLAITANTQTASCYLVKPLAIPALVESAMASLKSYQAGEPYYIYAYDQKWKIAQRNKLVFCFPTTPLAHQEPGFSDIENTHVSYDC